MTKKYQHAEVRGATIQAFVPPVGDRDVYWDWAVISSAANYSGFDLRVHPEHTHLEYGPISSVGVRMATEGKWKNWTDDEVLYANVVSVKLLEYLSHKEHRLFKRAPKWQKMQFIGLVSEELAHQGL